MSHRDVYQRHDASDGRHDATCRTWRGDNNVSVTRHCPLRPCHCCVSCAPLIARHQRSTGWLVRRPSIAPDGCCVNGGPHPALEQRYDRSRCRCHGRHGLTMLPRLGCQIVVLAMFVAIFTVFYYHNQVSHNKASGATVTAKRCMCHASCYHHCARGCCRGLRSHNTSNLWNKSQCLVSPRVDVAACGSGWCAAEITCKLPGDILLLIIMICNRYIFFYYIVLIALNHIKLHHILKS